MSKEVNQLTRESLETALVLLLENKELADISITELTQKAGVSRGAYYRNYSSKKDILRSYMENLLREIDSKAWTSVGPENNFENYWLTMFTEWKNHAKVSAILGKNGLAGEILFRVNRNSDSYYPEDAKWARYREYLLYGAMSNITNEWVRGGMKESPEEMAHFCSYMLRSLRGRYTDTAKDD